MNKFEEGIPEALELIVSALRVGHSLNAAMGLVSRECADPVGGEFRLTFDEMNYGLELKSALDNLVVRVPLQDIKIVCTAILIQRESGGNLAEVLEKTSQVIRERFRLKSNLWKKDLGLKLLYAAGTMIVIGGLIIRKIVNMDV